MLGEGDKVPALKTKLSDGTELDLSSPRQPTVLYFYPKDDTSGCTREAQDFTEMAGDYARAGVKVQVFSSGPTATSPAITAPAEEITSSSR